MDVTLKDVAREAPDVHRDRVACDQRATAILLGNHCGTAETPVVLMNTPVRGYGHSAFCVGRVSMTFPWRAS